MLLLHDLFVGHRRFESIETQFETAGLGLLAKDREHAVVHWHHRIADRNRKPRAVGLGQDAVLSLDRVARLAEGRACELDRVGPRANRWITEGHIAFVECVKALAIAAEHHINHFLPIHRVLDADPHIELVQGRFGDIQVKPARDLRVAVVKGHPLDVTLVHRLNLRLLVPQLRPREIEGVEFAGAKQLKGLGFVAHDRVHDFIGIETMFIVLPVARPPILHAGLGDRHAFDDIVRPDLVRAGGRRKPPLVAFVVIRAVLRIKMRRRGRDRTGECCGVGLRFGQ